VGISIDVLSFLALVYVHIWVRVIVNEHATVLLHEYKAEWQAGIRNVTTWMVWSQYINSSVSCNVTRELIISRPDLYHGHIAHRSINKQHNTL